MRRTHAATRATGAMAAALALALAGPAAAAETPVDGTGAEFADSVGVNIHEFYPDTTYLDKPRLKSLLLDLGVTHVRDGLRFNREPYVTEYPSARDIAAAGIKFDWIAGTPGDPQHATDAMALLSDPARLGGTAEALEGPNEYDGARRPNATLGKDPVWDAKLLSFMAEYYETFKNDSRFSALPFWGPSFLSDGGRDEYAATPGASKLMDRPNAHSYPGGRPPEPVIDAAVDKYEKQFGAGTPAITETGYHTATNTGNSGHYGVSERAQAIYVARDLLTAFAAGVPRTYLYQFLDQKPEPALKDMEEHFGLVAVDGDRTAAPGTWTVRKKPAFDTVKKLLAIERDSGTDARPAGLDYSLTGGAGLRKLLLARSGGVVDLVLWNPARVYNDPTWDCNDPRIPSSIVDPIQRCEYAKYNLAVDGGDAFPAAVPVTLQLAGAADVSTERPYSETAFTALGHGSTFSLNVGADPLVVRIKLSKYATEVKADHPSAWLRFAETAGNPVDSANAGASPGAWTATPTYGAASAVGDQDDAAVHVGPGQQTTVQLASAVSTQTGATVELWVKPDVGSPDWAHFLTADVGDWTVAMRTYNQHDGATWGSTYGSAFGAESVFRGFDQGSWHHLVLAMANGTSTTYLDGRAVGTAGGGSLNLSRFTAGARGGAGGFAGALDELAVYPTALGAGRVCAHYRAAGGSC
jgi:Concanavalin A-like lectin/glucanases superfamily